MMISKIFTRSLLLSFFFVGTVSIAQQSLVQKNHSSGSGESEFLTDYYPTHDNGGVAPERVIVDVVGGRGLSLMVQKNKDGSEETFYKMNELRGLLADQRKRFFSGQGECADGSMPMSSEFLKKNSVEVQKFLASVSPAPSDNIRSKSGRTLSNVEALKHVCAVGENQRSVQKYKFDADGAIGGSVLAELPRCQIVCVSVDEK